MQAKALKLRNQKRKMPKELMRSGIVPNRGVLGEYKERAKGLGISEAEVDNLIRTIYKRDPIVGIPAGRTEVLELLKELKHQVPEMLFFVVLDNCWYNVTCFFNAKKTCFVLAYTDQRRLITKRSIEYASKERALQVYHSGKVVWVSCKSLAKEPASIQSG